jgi:hypothetical protein
VIDYSTRYPEAVPLKRVTAKVVADTLVGVFVRFGIPTEMLSDNGSVFVSRLTKALMKSLGVTQLLASPYHPQTNGALERWHSTLKAILRKGQHPHQDWDLLLPYATFASRDTPHSTTGFTPFELLFGREVCGPLTALRDSWMEKPSSTPSVLEYMDNLRSRWEDALDKADATEKADKTERKLYYDRSARDDPIAPGEKVWVMQPDKPGGLQAGWSGPYTVLERQGQLTYKIQIPGGRRKGTLLHRNLIKRYHPPAVSSVVIADSTPDEAAPLELPPLSSQGQGKPHFGNQLTPSQRQDLEQLTSEFSTVFTSAPGDAKVPPLRINTCDHTPLAEKPRLIPPKWKPQLKEVRELLKMGIIEPSRSPWASNLVCVPKPDGTVRMCVDYRRLNAVTTPDPYPMPRVEHLIDKVASANYISTLDLSKGYYQFPLSPDDREKTAFLSPAGKFQFTRMPFGLKGAPAHFQRAMDALFADIDGVDVYLDDIVIHSATWEEHLQLLRTVLTILQQSDLTAKPATCTL